MILPCSCHTGDCVTGCYYSNKPVFEKENKKKNASELKLQEDVISPFFAGIVTGFVMGEGSFYISISASKTHKVGYQLRPKFQINLAKKDADILEKFRLFFGCGKVVFDQNSVRYVVSRFKDLMEMVIPFFDEYSLENIKALDFQYFKLICYKLAAGEGKSTEGIQRIISIREEMNGGGCKTRKNIQF